jgi:WD40-like Beta Propeller Repeat
VRRENELERRLREAPIPDESGAEQRAWDVIRAAYAERTHTTQAHPARRLALAAAAGVAALAIGLSPAGAKVGDLVEDVIGEEDAKPALRSLPAAGELLVESESGPWIVRADGSKRLLGDYEQATWSPRGLFVAASAGRELIALEPDGDVRWTITAPGPVSDPAWSPSGFRIAYRSGDDAHVVAGDGTGDHLVARNVAPVAPVWLLSRKAKLAADPTGPGTHVLAYVDSSKTPRAVDVDSGAGVRLGPSQLDRLAALEAGIALFPDGGRSARVARRGDRSALILEQDGKSRPIFSGPGRLTDPTWSPDGRWLLVGWPPADQWLFIRSDDPRRVIAVDDISSQFDPGGMGEGGFPRVSGWLLPQR